MVNISSQTARPVFTMHLCQKEEIAEGIARAETITMKKSDCEQCYLIKERNGITTFPECFERDYYEIHWIEYCHPQMIFLIEYLETIELCEWPVNSKDDIHTQQNRNTDASFVKIAVIYSDVSRRLKKTGKDGEVLKHEIQVLGARAYEDLYHDARKALNYISGKSEKKLPYRKWKYKVTKVTTEN